jgi:hypothetical protein
MMPLWKQYFKNLKYFTISFFFPVHLDVFFHLSKFLLEDYYHNILPSSALSGLMQERNFSFSGYNLSSTWFNHCLPSFIVYSAELIPLIFLWWLGLNSSLWVKQVLILWATSPALISLSLNYKLAITIYILGMQSNMIFYCNIK